MIIRIRWAHVGYGHRSSLRLMPFYLADEMFVAVMPHGCHSCSQDDFTVENGDRLAHCQKNCPSCQFGKTLRLEDIDDAYHRFGVTTQSLPPAKAPITSQP